MAENNDVVICGAGVIGAATAYYLARRGGGVTLIEASEVAHGASGYSGGLISAPRFELLESPLAAMLEQAYALHGELAESLPEESGVDYRFQWAPSPILAMREAEAVAYLGAPTGQLDSYLYAKALIAAAQRAGASLQIGRVNGLERDGDHVTGAELAGGEVVSADSVVIAMGLWSIEAGEWLGSPVEVEPLKGQILRLRPESTLPLAGFSNVDDDYVMAKASGMVYTGTTEERAGFDARPTVEARAQIRAFGQAHSSQLGKMEVVQQTACLRPLSKDDLPIIGARPGGRGGLPGDRTRAQGCADVGGGGPGAVGADRRRTGVESWI